MFCPLEMDFEKCCIDLLRSPFLLTAGLGAYLWMRRGHHSKGELSRLLVTRGIWLVVLEVTILRVIMFSQVSYTATPVLLIILWAIGLSMIALAALIYLPMRALAGISIAIIAFHNLLAGIPAESLGRAAWIWDILYQRGVIVVGGVTIRPAYPVLPWVAVMAGGYCLGTVFEWDADRRRRFLVRWAWRRLRRSLWCGLLIAMAIRRRGLIRRRRLSRCSLFST